MGVVISKDGTRIGFDREGQGPPVLLVDGAMCYRGQGPMKPLAAKLAPHFTVFTYDRRGRGESGDTQPWSLDREVEDIAALVREAGQPVYLYGISSGAVLACRVLRNTPFGASSSSVQTSSAGRRIGIATVSVVVAGGRTAFLGMSR